jgi:hypothetical protein
VLPYKEGEPPPEGYYLAKQSRRGLTIAGAAVFGGAYGLSVIGALSVLTDSHGDDGYEPLFIPIVGPFITMGTADNTELGGNGLGALFLLDGLAQTAGAVMFIIGMASDDKRVYKRNDTSSALPAPEILVGPGSASVRWQF